MPFFRGLVMLLLAIGVACLVAYLVTGQQRYRTYAVRLLKWTIVGALGFFAVLIVERLVSGR